MDITKPLRTLVKTRLGNSGLTIWLEFKYEKLPDFCFHCRRIGHTWKQCTAKDAPSEPPEAGFGYENSLRGTTPNRFTGTFRAPGRSLAAQNHRMGKQSGRSIGMGRDGVSPHKARIGHPAHEGENSEGRVWLHNREGTRGAALSGVLAANSSCK